MRPKTTMAQRMASRENGLKGGRSAKKTSELRRADALRQKAALIGRREALENIRLLLHFRNDTSASAADRIAAIREIEDRYGTPRQQVNTNMNIDAEPVKLFVLQPFKAPETWHDSPPTSSEATVLPDGPATNGANGAAH